MAAIGAGLVLIAYVVDRVAGSGLSSSVVAVGRVAVIVGAVVCAGVLYQLWSTRRDNDLAHHAGMAAALFGGALAASSAFSAPSGEVFASRLSAALGVAGLALALIAARPGRVPTEGRRS